MESTLKCRFPDCGNPICVQTRRLCTGHYQQFLAGKDLRTLKYQTTPQQRFWPKVKKTATCWTWTGSTDSSGYGLFWMNRANCRAHRVSYEWVHGPIPDGKLLDHICHNILCVNPSHLRVVTNKQNGEHRRGAACNSKSGIRGVYFDKKREMWVVRVGHNGKQLYGGMFPTKDEAGKAAIALRNSLYTHNDLDRTA